MNTWFIMLAAVWLSVPSAPVVDPPCFRCVNSP